MMLGQCSVSSKRLGIGSFGRSRDAVVTRLFRTAPSSKLKRKEKHSATSATKLRPLQTQRRLQSAASSAQPLAPDDAELAIQSSLDEKAEWGGSYIDDWSGKQVHALEEEHDAYGFAALCSVIFTIGIGIYWTFRNPGHKTAAQYVTRQPNITIIVEKNQQGQETNTISTKAGEATDIYTPSQQLALDNPFSSALHEDVPELLDDDMHDLAPPSEDIKPTSDLHASLEQRLLDIEGDLSLLDASFHPSASPHTTPSTSTSNHPPATAPLPDIELPDVDSLLPSFPPTGSYHNSNHTPTTDPAPAPLNVTSNTIDPAPASPSHSTAGNPHTTDNTLASAATSSHQYDPLLPLSPALSQGLPSFLDQIMDTTAVPPTTNDVSHPANTAASSAQRRVSQAKPTPSPSTPDAEATSADFAQLQQHHSQSLSLPPPDYFDPGPQSGWNSSPGQLFNFDGLEAPPEAVRAAYEQQFAVPGEMEAAEEPSRAVQLSEVQELSTEATLVNLRNRTQISLRAAAAASEASRRASAYSAAASSAASKAAEAAERAALAATSAQLAMETSAEDAITAAEARVARAVEMAAEAENKAASAAALATAYQDIAETQASVAEKAASIPKQVESEAMLDVSAYPWHQQLQHHCQYQLTQLGNVIQSYIAALGAAAAAAFEPVFEFFRHLWLHISSTVYGWWRWVVERMG